MKTLITVCAISILMLGCSTTKNRGTSPSEKASSTVKVSNLLTYLDTVPRLRVEGQGPEAKVVNTSVSSFTGVLTPLFVLDGIQVGMNYSDVSNLLSQNEYVSVQFLTTRRATIRFGEAGKNGAILINRTHDN